jgi:hypothetical protein
MPNPRRSAAALILATGLLVAAPVFAGTGKPSPRPPAPAPSAAASAVHGNPLIDFVRHLFADSGAGMDGNG